MSTRRVRWRGEGAAAGFDPALVDLVLSLRTDENFWSSLAADPQQLVSSLEPDDRQVIADEARLDRVAEAFALVIDAKSPYTFRHSSRVAELAVATGSVLGLDPAALRDLRRAWLLHHIGKLAVPTSILDKPGRLDAAERAQIELHPQLSERVLARVPAFSVIAVVAGAHHERLDGSGYWRGCTGERLSQSARILAVADVYEALTAERPYRPSLPATGAAVIVREEVAGGRLCGQAAEALDAALGRTREPLAA